MLKNLKSLFIVEDEPAKPAAQPTEAQRPTQAPLNDQRTGSPAASPTRTQSSASPSPQPTLARDSATSASRNPSSSPSKGDINTAIVAKLLDGVDRNDLEGFDYLEYKRSLKAMESLPMDEATKYRSAFATASTVGATLDKLLSSTDYYLHTLEQERAQFDGVVERQFQDQVAGRRAQLEQLETRISEKREQIKALEAEIAESLTEARAQTLSVRESEIKIENTRRDFDASFEYVKQLFVQDAEKMRRYLK